MTLAIAASVHILLTVHLALQWVSYGSHILLLVFGLAESMSAGHGSRIPLTLTLAFGFAESKSGVQFTSFAPTVPCSSATVSTRPLLYIYMYAHNICRAA